MSESHKSEHHTKGSDSPKETIRETPDASRVGSQTRPERDRRFEASAVGSKLCPTCGKPYHGPFCVPEHHPRESGDMEISTNHRVDGADLSTADLKEARCDSDTKKPTATFKTSKP